MSSRREGPDAVLTRSCFLFFGSGSRLSSNIAAAGKQKVQLPFLNLDRQIKADFVPLGCVIGFQYKPPGFAGFMPLFIWEG